MKRNAFTLVELLAVIAILAILIIIALPNVLKMYTNAKKDVFLNEVKTLYKESEKKVIEEATNGNKIDFISSNSPTALNMTGHKIQYCINLINNKVSSISVSDGKYYVVIPSIDSIDQISADNVLEGGYENLSCDSNNYGEGNHLTQSIYGWALYYESPNGGYPVIYITDKNSFDLTNQSNTTLGGVSINTITHNGELYYLVTNEAQFNAIRYKLDGKFLQLNDITITNYLSPIGSTVGSEWESVPFSGYYNGLGYKLIVEDMNTSYVGVNWALFPLTNNAILKGMNVSFPNGLYSGSANYAAGLVAVATNTNISGCFVDIRERTGIVQYDAGLLAASASNTHIIDSYAMGALEINNFSSELASYGGIVGRIENHSVVERTYAVVEFFTMYEGEPNIAITSSLTGQRSLGGIVGSKDTSSYVGASYYDSSFLTFQKNGYGIGKSTSQLKQYATFVNWPFR
ncbi:MAG: prepilin-type N-terminal cleavage/methylation domain-containing protein [Tenericutes bacterium]|nr:prepilin-type N-terminal cleavage/methylation domain-containing protein [Mycoplasmatota bacterium]